MLRLGNADVALCCVVLRYVALDVAFGGVSGRCVSLRFVTSDVALRVTFNISQDARSMLRYVALGVALSATSALSGLVALCRAGGCVVLRWGLRSAQHRHWVGLLRYVALQVALCCARGCAQRNIGLLNLLRYVAPGVALSATSALGGLVALCCVAGCVMLRWGLRSA
jgi:hypothetical protein